MVEEVRCHYLVSKVLLHFDMAGLTQASVEEAEVELSYCRLVL